MGITICFYDSRGDPPTPAITGFGRVKILRAGSVPHPFQEIKKSMSY